VTALPGARWHEDVKNRLAWTSFRYVSEGLHGSPKTDAVGPARVSGPVQRNADRLHAYLLRRLLALGAVKLSTEGFDISIRTNPPSVVGVTEAVGHIGVHLHHHRHQRGPAVTGSRFCWCSSSKRRFRCLATHHHRCCTSFRLPAGLRKSGRAVEGINSVNFVASGVTRRRDYLGHLARRRLHWLDVDRASIDGTSIERPRARNLRDLHLTNQKPSHISFD
jgi:hypothetical protein